MEDVGQMFYFLDWLKAKANRGERYQYKHWIREPNVNEEGGRLIESLQQRDSGHSVTDASNDNQPWIQDRNNIMSLFSKYQNEAKIEVDFLRVLLIETDIQDLCL